MKRIKRLSDFPTPEKYVWMPEQKYYKMYHGTSSDFLNSIIENGIVPREHGRGEIKDVLSWVGDDYNLAKQHILKRIDNFGGEPVILHLNIDTDRIGLHQSLIPGFYTVHEVIPSDMIEKVDYIEKESRIGKKVKKLSQKSVLIDCEVKECK
jgi:RNA:NAD 2'-phosphotransferase (TPT1/KptA family)